MDQPLPLSLQPLATLLERATAERDEAVARLYLLLENQRRLSGQQDQLLGYRRDYQARWASQFRQGAAMEVVHSYQAFVSRLEHALQQLHGQLEDARRQADLAREQLMQCETRVASVRKLLERREREITRRAGVHEQKHNDEIATATTWRGGALLSASLNS